MKKLAIRAGNKYGRLTAIKFHHKDKWRHPYWLFKCKCGNKKVIDVYKVTTKATKSCGCLHKELLSKNNATHRMTKTPTYISWIDMKTRCYNQKYRQRRNYKDKGITICDRWKNSFENFYQDMGKRPAGKTLDRINNDGNYELNNCRWATAKQQANNTSKNCIILFNKQAKTLAEWSQFLNIKYSTIHSRLNRGWSINKSLTKKICK